MPLAFIVREDDKLTKDMVNQFMMNQVSSYKQLLGGIRWIDTIPKSAAGKILRNDLKVLI